MGIPKRESLQIRGTYEWDLIWNKGFANVIKLRVLK